MENVDAKTDRLGRIDTSMLYPPFLEMLNELIARCEKRGFIYVATSGTRSIEKQDEIYAIGRTTPPIGESHIVTKARGGQSWHNFGCAVDFCRHRGSSYDGRLDPDYRDVSYVLLAEQATDLGLEAGLDWPSPFVDAQHIQLPLRRAGFTREHLTAHYRAGGWQGLFAELDTYTWRRK